MSLLVEKEKGKGNKGKRHLYLNPKELVLKHKTLSMSHRMGNAGSHPSPTAVHRVQYSTTYRCVGTVLHSTYQRMRSTVHLMLADL